MIWALVQHWGGWRNRFHFSAPPHLPSHFSLSCIPPLPFSHSSPFLPFFSLSSLPLQYGMRQRKKEELYFLLPSSLLLDWTFPLCINRLSFSRVFRLLLLFYLIWREMGDVSDHMGWPTDIGQVKFFPCYLNFLYLSCLGNHWDLCLVSIWVFTESFDSCHSQFKLLFIVHWHHWSRM